MSPSDGNEAASPVLDTAALVERIAKGDRSAESALFNHYARGVRALVARRCRPCDPAVDDLTQDVLTALLEQLRKGALNNPAAFPGYLQTCIHRMTMAEYRKRGRRPDQVTLDEAPPAVDEAQASDQILDQEQQDRQVRELVRALPVQRDRQMLADFYLRGMSKDEVCRKYELDVVHMRRVLHRARTRLKTLLVNVGLRQDSP